MVLRRYELHVAVLVLQPVNDAIAALAALAQRKLEELAETPITRRCDLVMCLLCIFAYRARPVGDEGGEPAEGIVMSSQHLFQGERRRRCLGRRRRIERE